MLLTDFKNYAEFKENYSEDSSIRKSLAIDVIKTLNRTKGPFIGVEHAGIASFSEWTLANLVIRCLDLLNNNDGDVHIMGYTFKATGYKTDERNGVLEDQKEYNCIRLCKPSALSTRPDRIVKATAGKIIRKIILEDPEISKFSERSITYLCERFSFIWISHCMKKSFEDFDLYVDKDFKRIYDKSEHESDFHSCMSGVGHYDFFNCIDASAAYIIHKKNHKMYGRCIIYNNVYDVSKKKFYRLAERQYARDDKYRQMLVDFLISEDKIDGYKTVGAGCNDCHSFNNVLDGSSMNNNFVIGFNPLANGAKFPGLQIISYMDSFKYLSTEPSLDSKFIEPFKNKYTRFIRNDSTGLDSCFNFSTTGSFVETNNCGNKYIDNLNLEAGRFDVMDVNVWLEKPKEYRRYRTKKQKEEDFAKIGLFKVANSYYDEVVTCKKCGSKLPRQANTTLFEVEGCTECSKFCKLLDSYFDKNKLIEMYNGEWIPLEFSARDSTNHIVMNPMLLRFIQTTESGVYKDADGSKEISIKELLKKILNNL